MVQNIRPIVGYVKDQEFIRNGSGGLEPTGKEVLCPVRKLERGEGYEVYTPHKGTWVYKINCPRLAKVVGNDQV